MAHMWLGQVPHWVKSHIGSSPTCEWAKSNKWMSHVPYVNESCPIREWVMAHMRESLNPACLWILSNLGRWIHIRISHGPYVHESWHTYVRVMEVSTFSTWFRFGKIDLHMYESWPIREGVMAHICLRGLIGVSIARGEGKFVLIQLAF